MSSNSDASTEVSSERSSLYKSLIDENDLILRVLNLGHFKDEKSMEFRFQSMTSFVNEKADKYFKFTDEELKNEAIYYAGVQGQEEVEAPIAEGDTGKLRATSLNAETKGMES